MSQQPVDIYILETLMPDLVGHDRLPSAFLVYLYLWHKAAASDGWRIELSHRAIADGTGLSKRIIQTAVHHLIRRKLLSANRETITAIPCYTVMRPWAKRMRS
ncbi:MAG TPA: helix-turn-helix domain-containing protein [Gemmatimonadaceae bacterium]|nr:helix-turn-helix domain-containing protein [Gemmatimonadaceae bacterium]